MKLETFITNYMTDGSKDKYIKSVIRPDYVSYSKKCSDCERIILSCHYQDIDGKRRFVINSPAQAMMFSLLLVDRYTKIDVEYTVDTYDELQKSGALGMIVSALPEAEYQEYSTIMHMFEDDLIMKETCVASRMDDLKQAVSSFVSLYLDAMSEVAKGGDNNGDILEGTTEGA